MPCQQTARYVIVETTYDAPEDDPVAGAMLEICEIEVYGIRFIKKIYTYDNNLFFFFLVNDRYTCVKSEHY